MYDYCWLLTNNFWEFFYVYDVSCLNARLPRSSHIFKHLKGLLSSQLHWCTKVYVHLSMHISPIFVLVCSIFGCTSFCEFLNWRRSTFAELPTVIEKRPLFTEKWCLEISERPESGETINFNFDSLRTMRHGTKKCPIWFLNLTVDCRDLRMLLLKNIYSLQASIRVIILFMLYFFM